MGRGKRTGAMLIAALAAAGAGLTGCGDDNPSGPQFGDLDFVEGLQDIGTGRDAVVTLRNVSDAAIGPLLVGGEPGDGLGLIVGEICIPMIPDVTPSSVSSLAPGAEIEITVAFDLTGVTIDDCRAGDYDVDVNASFGSSLLAATTIRLSFSGEG